METSREKGGRPTGTTKKRKHSTNLAIIGAKNEITKKYKRELDNRPHKVRMPKGRLTAIIEEVKEKNKLGADIIIAEKLSAKELLEGQSSQKEKVGIVRLFYLSNQPL